MSHLQSEQQQTLETKCGDITLPPSRGLLLATWVHLANIVPPLNVTMSKLYPCRKKKLHLIRWCWSFCTFSISSCSSRVVIQTTVMHMLYIIFWFYCLFPANRELVELIYTVYIVEWFLVFPSVLITKNNRGIVKTYSCVSQLYE